MVAVPVQRTWADTDALNTTNLNGYISDPLKFLLNRPAARLRQTTAQTLTTSVATSVLLNVEDLDSDPGNVGAHSTVSNTSRYTARYPGWYLVAGSTSYNSSGTGRRCSRWAVNGSAVNGGDQFMGSWAGSGINCPARTLLLYLDVGDYVELQAYHEHGSNLTTNSGIVGQQIDMTVLWERLTA